MRLIRAFERWGDGGGVFGVTKGLAERFGPVRVGDTPVSEEGIVAVGVGAALSGPRPVVELMYADFLTLAMEPLVNQAAKIRGRVTAGSGWMR